MVKHSHFSTWKDVHIILINGVEVLKLNLVHETKNVELNLGPTD